MNQLNHDVFFDMHIHGQVKLLLVWKLLTMSVGKLISNSLCKKGVSKVCRFSHSEKRKFTAMPYHVIFYWQTYVCRVVDFWAL